MTLSAFGLLLASQTWEDPVLFPCEHGGCKDCMVDYLVESGGKVSSPVQVWPGVSGLTCSLRQAVCPACGDGPEYTQDDLYRAVKQEAGASSGKPEVISLSDSDDSSDGEVKKPSSSRVPLFRARSDSTRRVGIPCHVENRNALSLIPAAIPAPPRRLPLREHDRRARLRPQLVALRVCRIGWRRATSQRAPRSRRSSTI